MNDRTESLQFDEVKRRLQPGEVFQGADHDWKTRNSNRWKGTCPWHESSSGTCFTVNPETLEWKCFSCDRGGGPLQYVAELESVGTGARGTLKGREFFRAWKALSRHAGCEGPPDFATEEDSGEKSSDRRPLRNPKGRKGTARKRPATATAGGPSMSHDIRPARDSEPDLDTPESELRKALSRYRKALKESEKARAYVEGRGLSVGTLHAHGCGFAPAGEWIGGDNAPRLVTPHTTPRSDSSRSQLVNLSGRYVGTCGDGKRHRHIGGNPTALFNAGVIEAGDGPLVICEGPLDALSFIEAGWERTVALHNTDGVPWGALRGNVETLVFAFDADGTGREDAKERAIEATRRGYDAHTLHDEAAYRGHGDPNEALQAGELTLDYLRNEVGTAADSGSSENKPMTDGENAVTAAGAEGSETPTDGSGAEADRSPTQQKGSADAGEGKPTAADLIPHWNGRDIGRLGRWLWERGGVPEGNVGAGLYADRELHVWIKEKLEAGPQATDRRTQTRLRWVLWRLYAAHGPEEVPESQIPIPPMRRA